MTDRKRKLLLSSGTGLAKQLTSVICGFILPRYMLLYFGSSVNGLVSSIQHFLLFITLLEMGIGPVIQSNLYKPLAGKDDKTISLIVKSSKRFFRTIGLIFLVYIAILTIAYPRIVNTSFDYWYTASLVVILSLSIIAEYFFGMTYQILLNADQKAYIQQITTICTILLNTVVSIILMRNGASIHVVKTFTAFIFILKPVVFNVYISKHYRIDNDVILQGEPIKQKWNGFSQHLASVVCQNIDVVLLSLFSSLQNVSIYNVYFLVTNGVTQIIMTTATGLESFFGNMIANNENELLTKTFDFVEWFIHTIVIIIFSVAAITICPFVSVYTKGVNDANYIVPEFGFLLVLAYTAQCLRIPYFRIIKAAGHFKQTQNGAFISTGINIIVSALLVKRLGLIGVGVGTLAAMLFHTGYFVWYLKKNILFRPMKLFLIYLFFDIVVICSGYFISRICIFNGLSYLQWVVYALKCMLIVVLEVALISVVFFKDKVGKCIGFLKQRKNR